MVKRFVIGFAVGVGLMHWYINHGDRVISDATNWTKKSASQYSDETVRKAAEAEFGR
jgi:hypothetical protein